MANVDFAAPTQGVDDDRRIFQLQPALAVDLDIGSRLNAYLEYFSELKTGGVADEHVIDGVASPSSRTTTSPSTCGPVQA